MDLIHPPMPIATLPFSRPDFLVDAPLQKRNGRAFNDRGCDNAFDASIPIILRKIYA